MSKTTQHITTLSKLIRCQYIWVCHKTTNHGTDNLPLHEHTNVYSTTKATEQNMYINTLRKWDTEARGCSGVLEYTEERDFPWDLHH